jgi:nitroreductase
MNAVLNAIAQRYSCRDFAPEAPASADLDRIGRAALHAPSAMNRQPWRVITVTDRDLLDQIEQAGLAALAKVNPASHKRIMDRGGRLLYGAPAVVIVAQAPPAQGAYPAPLDIGIVAATVALAAESLGIQSCIAALPGYGLEGPAAADLRTRLAFPEGYGFGIAILLGHAAGAPRQPHDPDPTKLVRI